MKQHIMVRDRDGVLRRAYDQKLFEDTISPEGVQIVQPPLPYFVCRLVFACSSAKVSISPNIAAELSDWFE